MESSPPPSSPGPADEPIPDEADQGNDMPLTMAASMVLTQLPQDAHAALEGAGELSQTKVNVRFQPVGAAPALSKRVFKITSTQRFEIVVNFLRKKLGVTADESVFCYINNVFAPGLDEVVGNLWRCFRVGDELIVGYARTPAFG